MLRLPMKPPGTYRLTYRSAEPPDLMDQLAPGESRVRRTLDSLREQISQAEATNLRIRQIFQNPREIFRVDLDLPGANCQRTTLLDRDALEDLLETEAVQDALGRKQP